MASSRIQLRFASEPKCRSGFTPRLEHRNESGRETAPKLNVNKVALTSSRNRHSSASDDGPVSIHQDSRGNRLRPTGYALQEPRDIPKVGRIVSILQNSKTEDRDGPPYQKAEANKQAGCLSSLAKTRR